MSSTDSGRRDRLLDSIYKEEFLRTARELSEQSVQLLADRPDPELQSYFIERERKEIQSEDFMLDLDDLKQVKQQLSKLSDGSEAEPLSRLFDKILALADHFESVDEVEDVSEYIYVMF